jgi:hypothetical protein
VCGVYGHAWNRERWPLLTVETGVNGNSKSTENGGFFLGYFAGLVMPGQEILFRLGCSSRPSTKYFFPHRTQFRFLCPHRPASWAGSRAGSPVSKYVSLVQNIIEGLTLVLRGEGAGKWNIGKGIVGICGEWIGRMDVLEERYPRKGIGEWNIRRERNRLKADLSKRKGIKRR